MPSMNGVLFYVFLSMVWKSQCLPSGLCKKLSENKRVMCERIFVWDSRQEVFVSLTNETLRPVTTEDRKSFSKKTIRVVVCNMMPYVSYFKYSRKLSGYLGNVWSAVQERFKFKCIIMPLNYNEGLKRLTAGKADVLLAAVVHKEHLINVYYSHPYFYNWYHLYYKSPEGKPLSLLYLKIFSARLWIASSLVFSMLVASIWITSRLLNATYHVEPKISLPSCFLGIVSGFMNQGFDLRLRSYSGRLQVMLALMLGAMLYYGMNAALVAKIAVSEAPCPFNSLSDIAAKRQTTLCLRNSSYVYTNFTDERNKILPEWQNVLNNKQCLDIKSPLLIPKTICENNVVVLESKIIMTSVSKVIRHPCKIKAFDRKYFVTGNSFLLLKSLKEKRVIDNYVLHMRSMGILQRLEQKWIAADTSDDDFKKTADQITMGHTGGVFVVYIFAMFVSLVVLGLEILYHRYLNCKS